MKLFHVDSSAKRDKSNSRALARHFIQSLRDQGVDLEIDYLDVSVDTPAHVDEAFAVATYRAPEDRTDEMKARLADSDALCARMFEADAFVFAMPMYNWSMPSAFKAFIDVVTRPALTYKMTPDGNIVGQFNTQKTLFITTRGADLRPGNVFAGMDALTPALKAAFGFIGVDAPTFVDAQPLQFSDAAAREAALIRAKAELDAVASQWAAEEREKLDATESTTA
ncbi:FMN-dependent NADH-azoreductase [Pararobbsia alpina]|uniref:FMN-dependent NADH-azoreductase n=1 Tax=Pararobbsia alpina TaxID=621374 RepID=UPI0039A6FBC1